MLPQYFSTELHSDEARVGQAQRAASMQHVCLSGVDLTLPACDAPAVCAPGFVEESGKCVQCPLGSYCRGGNGNGADASSTSAVDSATDTTTQEDGLIGGARSYIQSCGNSTAISTAMKGSIAESACGECLAGVTGTNHVNR